ncbi:hypothetical protein SOPP22_02310 [Shewanella sp. OPT22]|nr:hypothetical protein SOPP22_02310 [Shewanella sp. OPT22]
MAHAINKANLSPELRALTKGETPAITEMQVFVSLGENKYEQRQVNDTNPKSRAGSNFHNNESKEIIIGPNEFEMKTIGTTMQLQPDNIDQLEAEYHGTCCQVRDYEGASTSTYDGISAAFVQRFKAKTGITKPFHFDKPFMDCKNVEEMQDLLKEYEDELSRMMSEVESYKPKFVELGKIKEGQMLPAETPINMSMQKIELCKIMFEMMTTKDPVASKALANKYLEQMASM